MKKIASLSLLLVFFFCGYAQKKRAKPKTIYESLGVVLQVLNLYSHGQVVDTIVNLRVLNEAYNSTSATEPGSLAQRNKAANLNQYVYRRNRISSNASIFSGSPKKFYSFITQLQNFYERNTLGGNAEGDGVDLEIIDKQGTKMLLVRTQHELGFHIFSNEQLDLLMVNFKTWANENNIGIISSRVSSVTNGGS